MTNKTLKNKDMSKADAKSREMEKSSFCDPSQETLWYIASEVAGLPRMPTSTRRSRDELERLLQGRAHLKRKRTGTKGYEYHVSILPAEAQEQLIGTQVNCVAEPKTEYGSSPGRELPPVDRELLEMSIEAIELLCEKKRIRMSPKKKAKIITLVYMISLEDKKINESVCYELLELAS
ncbi:TPA: DNA-binding protein [Vibrio parahaemolyticus]